MDHDGELAEAKLKTYQLIGRNIVLFQQMEQLLKIVLPRATVSISSETEIPSMMTGRCSAVERCTLGNLVNRFIDEVCDPEESDLEESDPEESDPEGDSDQVNLTTTLRLIFETPEARDMKIKRLNDLVDGRNRLVHHFFSRFEVNSIRGWRSTHEDLEDQHQQILSEIGTLRQLLDAKAKSDVLFAHPEIQRELVYGATREQLIEELRAAAQESIDPDGWTSLKAAINRDDVVSLDVITELLKGYEIRTVTALLEAVGGFEIRHDKDQKGKARTFYRVTGIQDPSAPDSAEQGT